MSAMADCPQFASWPGLLGETLTPDERERYERHLEGCPVCQDQLDRCDECEDAWRQLARTVGDPTIIPADPTLTLVIERVGSKFGVPSEGRTPNPEHEPADLYFLRPADKPDLLGMLGAYEVQAVIGEGGMGVVLKAYEPALHRLVAIKVLAAAVAGSATARRRFTREAQAAAAVCHEHIVPVHGVHETDGLPYLVMQYVAGESLQDRLNRSGPLDVTEVVRIALQTASGLAAAHAQGLIHRDIKPANLLLENCLARVKITDFGLARMADDAPLTQPGVVAGTPEYMSPEQARGETVDHRADLFSLGSVIYAMCTGKPPFRAASAVAVLRQVSDVDAPPVRSLNNEMPAWLETFVARLMAKDPADRFQSAAEVAALLEGYLAHLRQPESNPAPALPVPKVQLEIQEPDPSTLRSSVQRIRRRLFAAVAAAIAAVSIWLVGGPQPPAGPAAPHEFYQDFRAGKPRSPDLKWAGLDGSEEIQPDDRGLRIKLPTTRTRKDPGGVALFEPVKGNFEVTAGYELVGTNAPKSGQGAGVELLLMVDNPTEDVICLARVRHPDGQEGFWCSYNVGPKNDRKYRVTPAPAVGPTGRLRIQRTGRQVTEWAADGTEDFREVARYDVGTDDMKMVRVGAYPGQSLERVDVRIVDLRVRANGLAAVDGVQTAASAGATSRGWLVAAEILTLALVIAGLAAWRRRRHLNSNVAEPEEYRPDSTTFRRWRPLFLLLTAGLCAAAIVFGLGKLQFSAGDTAPPAKIAPPAAPPPTIPFDVWSVTASKDGKIIVAGGGMWEQPGEIGIWETTTYKPLQRFAEEGGIASVALSPDGKTLASGGWSGHVRLRDWAAGKVLADFEVPGVSRVAFSPGGDLLASVTEAKTVQLWDVARRELLADLDGDMFRFHCVTFSPDGKRLLVGGGDWKPGGLAQVNVWDVASKQQIQKLTGHTNTILGLICSHDGKLIATGSLDKTIRLWDAASGLCLKTLTGNGSWVEGIAFSADDKTLVSGGHDQTIRFWDVSKGTETARIPSPVTIRTVGLTADGKSLIVGGIQKLLLVLDAASHKQQAILWDGRPSPAPAPTAMEALPSAVATPVRGRGWLAMALIGGLAVAMSVAAWIIARRNAPILAQKSRRQTASRTTRPEPEARRRRARLPAIAVLVSLGLGIGLILLSFAKADSGAGAVGDRRLSGHTGPVHNVRFAPDGRLVSGSGWPGGDRTVRVWDPVTGQEQKRIPLPFQIHALDISADSRFALVGMGNGEVVYVDLNAGLPAKVMHGHIGSVGWVGCAPDGKHAFSAAADGTARKWNMIDGKEQKRYTVVNKRARGGAIFPDGKRLLTGDAGGLLQIWDVDSGQEIKRIDRTGFIDSVDLLPDGKQALVTGEGGAHLYDLDSGRELRTFQEEAEEVHQSAVSPDGRQLLTASFDGIVRLWDFQSGKLIRALGSHDGCVFSAAFSPDGRWAASAGDGHHTGSDIVPGTDHDIRLWDLTAGGATTAANTRQPWLMAAGGIILLSALGFVAVYYSRRRTSGAEGNIPATPPTAEMVRCPGCGRAFKTKPEWAGKKAKCPCGHVVAFPTAATPVTKPADIVGPAENGATPVPQ